jgi:hypothetical protein
MSGNEINIRNGKVFIIERGIICQEIDSREEFTVKDAEEVVTVTANLSNGKPCPVLVSMGQIKSITGEARNYLQNNTEATAVAFLVTSLVSRLVGNLLLGLSKTVIPVKMFSCEKDALRWLRKYLQ